MGNFTKLELSRDIFHLRLNGYYDFINIKPKFKGRLPSFLNIVSKYIKDLVKTVFSNQVRFSNLKNTKLFYCNTINQYNSFNNLWQYVDNAIVVTEKLTKQDVETVSFAFRKLFKIRGKN